MVKLIPKIDKKIEKVLKSQKLRAKEEPADFILRTEGRKHRYSTICEDEKGEKFIFYARLQDSKAEKERMFNEVKIAKFLMKNKINFFPKYFKAKIEKGFEWILREYFRENTLESKREIEKLARPLKKEEILEICKTLILMQRLKFPFLKEREIKKFLILPREIKDKKILKREEVEKIEKIFKENLKLIKKENRYFCHGDFQIGNLIFKKQKLKVIDLESAMISNFAFDPCFFWIRLWREKKARREFLKKFFSLLPESKKKKFKILFQINSLFLGFHSFCANPREYSKKMLKKRKNFYLKVLKKAIFGFEKLKEI